MTAQLAQLLPSLRSLKRSEKLQVIQFLAGELAEDENEFPRSDMEYPVWSPHDAFEAASILMKHLKETGVDADA
jgi:hypothetical protein